VSRLHYCLNGVPVTAQVVKYQETRASEDYLPIQFYYDNYKDHWYTQLADYMDRSSFESDFDFKLAKAVESFREDTAKSIAKKRGYSSLGAFNGWFYTILRNYKSNVKTQAFRLKHCPSIQCPICGRKVARIDALHLRHYKTTRDIPKFITWKGNIYETSTYPKVYATTWGKKTAPKWRDLNNGILKIWTKGKRRVRWPWKTRAGERGVLCPYTRKVILEITDEYIQSLSDEHSRYADNLSWNQFVETYPASLIQSKVYGLDHISGSEEGALRDYVASNRRIISSSDLTYVNLDMIRNGSFGSYYEHAFNVIDRCVIEQGDKEICKLLAAGYSENDIAETLELEKKEVRQKIKEIKEDEDMKKMLIES